MRKVKGGTAETNSPLLKKGSEEMNEGMTESQTLRLIEWLKANGMTDEQIVECMKYINTKQ